VANQRKDLAHQLSRRLVDASDSIYLEDLRIANMIRRPKPVPDGEGGLAPNGARAKAGLNASIADAAWAQLTSLLIYKTADAGRSVILVDPHHTSQRCSACGHTAQENRRSQAEFRCTACGHLAHADINAARNVLRAGRARQASPVQDRATDPLPL
jgi:putative transposase